MTLLFKLIYRAKVHTHTLHIGRSLFLYMYWRTCALTIRLYALLNNENQ